MEWRQVRRAERQARFGVILRRQDEALHAVEFLHLLALLALVVIAEILDRRCDDRQSLDVVAAHDRKAGQLFEIDELLDRCRVASEDQ